MFHSARIKLTAWYLLIIMLISISFSMAIYKVLTAELDRVDRAQRLRIERILLEQLNIIPSPGIRDNFQRSLFIDPDLIAETKNRLKLMLTGIDIIILCTSATAGYFLAGRTLRPIREMVDEQRQFVDDASHELRTPLTAMKTETEVALREKSLSLASAKQLLKSNLEEINNLKSLTDYFLTLSNYQNSNNQLTFETFNIADVIRETGIKYQNAAKDKKINIVTKLKNVTIEANKICISEIITILLDNAIKYSNQESKITLLNEKKGNTVVMKVEDTGVGIQPSEIPFIFNRFYRADASRTRNKTKGYGLGLSIAKSIVDLHKGTIIVDSKIHKGSTFTITLPLKQERKFV